MQNFSAIETKEKQNECKELLPLKPDHPLAAIWKSDISLLGFKIIDIYLFKAAEAQCSNIILKKCKLEEMLGKNMNMKVIEKCLQRLQSPIFVETESGRQEILLFKIARVAMRKVELIGTEQLFQIFNKEMIEWISQELTTTLQFSRRFTYILFRYLGVNRPCGSCTVGVEELRKILGCTEKTYESYKYFNEKALRKAYQEICEGTNIQFTYDPIRCDRKVVEIRFNIWKLDDNPNIFPISSQSDSTTSDSDTNANSVDRI